MKILTGCLNKLVCVVFIVCIVSSCVDSRTYEYYRQKRCHVYKHH